MIFNTHSKFALMLTSILSISIGIMYALTMLFSTNGEIIGKPEYSRLADINLYHEGWIETILFLLIGLYGIYALNKIMKGELK